ncbi:MAG: radical SAM protein [Candidatus Omnitrophota bacterium]
MVENKIEQLEKIEICDLGIATDCNFKCKMCCFWKYEHHDNNLLDNEHWKKVIDQIGRLPNKNIKLIFSGGGEALLRPGIEDLLNYGSQKFPLILNTNGYLIDKKRAKLLARTVEIINISLDGNSSSTHDYLRGVDGAFDQVVKTIEYLREESQEMIININTVILSQNLGEMVSLLRWVDEKAVNGIIFQAVSSPNTVSYDKNWYKDEFKYLWPQETKKVQSVLDELIECKKKGSKIVNSFKQLDCFKNYFLNPESSIEALKCEVDRVIKIDGSGNIKMCDFSQPIGNLKTTPLIEVITSARAEEERIKAYQCKSPCHLLVNCFHDNGGE